MTATTARGTVLYPDVPEWRHFRIPGVTVVVPADAPRIVWEDARRHGVGGSDIASIAGIGYESPYTMWARKTGRPVAPFTEEALSRMRWGHALEPLVRDEFQWNHKEEFIVTPTPGTLAVTGMEHHRVNVDGLVWFADGTLAAVLECKTGSHHQVQHWDGEDEVPVSHAAQVQWAMYVTGAPCAWVAGLLDTHKYLERFLLRDQSLIDDLIPLADEFWSHVTADVPPPVDGSDSTSETLKRIEARMGSVVELDPELWASRAARIHAINAEIGALTAEKQAIANLGRAELGEHTIGAIEGEKIVTHTPITPQRSCDYDRLRSAWPEAYAACVSTKDIAPGVPPARKFEASRSKRALAMIAKHTAA